MKWIATILSCLVIQLFTIVNVEAQTNVDSLPEITYYHYQRDTDSISYVRIDSTLIHVNDTIRKIVLSKYMDMKFNFMDSTIKLDNRKYVNRNVIKLRKTDNHWIIFTFLFIILLYAIIRNVYDKTLVVIFQAYWNDRAISQFTRDDNFLKLRNTLLYFVLFTAVYGLLIMYVVNYFEIGLKYEGLDKYLFVCVCVGIFYFSKFVLMKMSGYVFSIQKLISGYLSILSISNFVYSIVIIPVLLFYQFVPTIFQSYLLGLILILFCFNTIYKYLRTGSFILNNFQFPKFYLFLYLCTLEIMPLLIIYKVLIA